MLEHGWAYGDGGTQLRGKITLNAITTGGPAAAYQHGRLQPVHDARAARAVGPDRAPVRHEVPRAVRRCTRALRVDGDDDVAPQPRRVPPADRGAARRAASISTRAAARREPRRRARRRARARGRSHDRQRPRAGVRLPRRGGRVRADREAARARRGARLPDRRRRDRAVGARPRRRRGPRRHALRRVRRRDDAVPRRPRAAARAAVAAAPADLRARRRAGRR